jgi:cell division septation protein DedD
MPHLPIPSRGASRLRRAIVPTLAMATLALLGGCSMWPKALSFQSDPLPAQAEPTPAPTSTVAPAPAPMSAVTPTSVHAPTAMPVEPKPEVTSSAVAAPAKVEAAPLRAIQPQPVAAPAPQAAAAPPMAVLPRTVPPRTVPASGLVRGFYINAGLFAVSSNGRNAYKILEDAGLPVFSDVVKSKQRTLTRVRVGPYATRAQADAAAKKIHGLKLAAIVFKH